MIGTENAVDIVKDFIVHRNTINRNEFIIYKKISRRSLNETTGLKDFFARLRIANDDWYICANEGEWISNKQFGVIKQCVGHLIMNPTETVYVKRYD